MFYKNMTIKDMKPGDNLQFHGKIEMLVSVFNTSLTL